MEENLFENALNRVYFFLRIINLGIDLDDVNKSFFERLRKRRIYCLHFVELNLNLFGEMVWLGDATINGRGTLEEYTNILPGLALGILGDLKSYFMIKYAHHVIDLIQTFQRLFKREIASSELKKRTKKRLKLLKVNNLILACTFAVGLSMFALGPLVITMSIYLSTGEVKLLQPFIVYYPFDANSLPMWPIVYFFQLWAAILAANFVYAPDCFYYTASTFIQIQFAYLQHDVDKLIERYPNGPKNRHNQSRHSELVEVVNRHRELMRCVDLLEIIYSKSALFNVVSSSIIICVTGFNIMVIKDVPLAVAFSFFLAVGFIQICLFCNCGQQIIDSSSKVGEAIYNSNWYDCSVPDMRDCLLILTRLVDLPWGKRAYGLVITAAHEHLQHHGDLLRVFKLGMRSFLKISRSYLSRNAAISSKDLQAQKSSKLTAYGFSVISINSFAKILSTSWSYFALLLTLYSGPQHSRS